MIQLRDINFGYGGRDLMDGLSLHIKPQDRIGLVGPNGAGKTTLLRIILGEIKDFTGEVSRRKGMAVGLLPQEGIYDSGRSVLEAALETFAPLIALEAEVEALNASMAVETDPQQRDELLERAGAAQLDFETRGGFTFRARTAQVLTGLGFSETDLQRDMSTFSGGWQMRVALGKLLLREPDILLLDEPTNHLDLPALLWFEEFLSTYPGAVLIISHDRAFLDRVVHRIAELSQKQLSIYTGGYSAYEVEKQKRLEILANRIENQEREIRQTERFIERFRYKSTKARQVQSRIKSLEKMERLEMPGQERSLNFSFQVQKPSGKEVIRLTGVNKAYGENHVLRDVKLALHRGDRMAIIGANGLGKTTLMRVLAGRTEFTGERKVGHNTEISYFSQDQFELLNPDNTVIEEATGGPAGPGGTPIRSLLGVFLFSGTDVDKPVRVLSGGEKSRLLFARMMASPANFMVLDEPTNHLDPPSQAMLARVLNSYNGTLCVVSHNRWFINEVANRIVEMTPGGMDEYLGNYEDYKYQKRMRAQDQAALAAGDDNEQPAPAAVSERKVQRQERARFVQERSRALTPIRTAITETEALIDELEARIADIEEELADPASYNDAEKMRTLPAELKQCKTSLEQAMEYWEELSEDLAGKEKEFE